MVAKTHFMKCTSGHVHWSLVIVNKDIMIMAHQLSCATETIQIHVSLHCHQMMININDVMIA